MRDKLQLTLQKPDKLKATSSTPNGNPYSNTELFHKSHMPGFNGIKQKYLLNQTVNFDRREKEHKEKAELSFN